MKPIIQFVHANGFPAKTYSYFFKQFPNHDFSYIPVMGHEKYGIHPDWQPLGKELIEHIKKNQNQPVIGIGHSLGGGALAYAAHWQPQLFKKIILLDPPFFSPFKRNIIRFGTMIGQIDKFGPSGRAKARKDHFENYDAVFEYFKPKKLFKNFHERCFEDYVNYAFIPSEKGGLKLAFTKEVEADVFRTCGYQRGKTKFQMPSYFIYSAQYEILPKKNIQWLKKKYPNTEFIPFDGGHLFPLEQPKKTAQLITQLIDN